MRQIPTVAALLLAGLATARADGLMPAGVAAQGLCFATGSSGPRVPCVMQDGVWTRVLRPTDEASGLTVATRPLTDRSTAIANTEFVKRQWQGTTIAANYLTDTACGSLQTAQLLAAEAATPPGGRVLLPPGCILIDQTYVTRSRVLEGVGASRAFGTEIRYAAPSGPAINLLGPGARATGLRITCTADRDTSTATAIQLSDGVENPRSQRLDNIAVTDCLDQVDVRSGEMWTADRMDLYRAKRWGFRIRNGFHPDSGDGSISNSLIYTDVIAGGKAAVRLESGGGLKMTGNKTLQFERCFDLAVADGAHTSILQIDSSNSFENPTLGECIRLGRIEGGTTGTYKNITISAQLTGALQIFDGVSNVTVATNTSNVDFGVAVLGGQGINVTAATTLAGLRHGVVIRDPAKDVTVGQFACTDCETTLEDERVTAPSLRRIETRTVDLPQSASFVPLYRLDVPVFQSARVAVSVQGILQGVGAVNTEIAQMVTRHSPGIALTEVSRTVAGAPVDVQLDLSKAGAVIVGVRPSADAGGGRLQGAVTVTVDGRIGAFRVLR